MFRPCAKEGSDIENILNVRYHEAPVSKQKKTS